MRPANRQGVDPSRPKTVIYAVYLAFAALAIQATVITINLVTGQFGASVEQAAAVILVVGVAGLLTLEALLIYGTWLGRNGPRIIYIGLLVFSTMSAFTSGGWAKALALRPAITALGTFANGLELVAVVLLLLPMSNAWFREMRAAKISARATRGQQERPQGITRPRRLEKAMSEDRRQQVYTNFSQKETDELVEIWQTNDHAVWTETVFDVIREILQERFVELPPQGEPIHETNRPKETSTEWTSSRGSWVPFAISFVLALAADVWIIDLVSRNNLLWAGWMAPEVFTVCFPVPAVILAIGAWLGAKAAADGRRRWQGATYGVWVAAVPALILSVVGVWLVFKMAAQ